MKRSCQSRAIAIGDDTSVSSALHRDPRARAPTRRRRRGCWPTTAPSWWRAGARSRPSTRRRARPERAGSRCTRWSRRAARSCSLRGGRRAGRLRRAATLDVAARLGEIKRMYVAPARAAARPRAAAAGRARGRGARDRAHARCGSTRTRSSRRRWQLYAALRLRGDRGLQRVAARRPTGSRSARTLGYAAGCPRSADLGGVGSRGLRRAAACGEMTFEMPSPPIETP